MRLLGRLALVLTTVAAWLPAAAGTATADPAGAAVAPPALINADFPDPDVLQAGATYYAYSTSAGPVAPGRQRARRPRARGPSAATPCPTSRPGPASGGFWAPDVSRRADGRYLMYFTGPSTGAGRHVHRRRDCDRPARPVPPVGSQPLVCDASEGGDIDPSSFVDGDGTRYLLYKNDGNAIGAGHDPVVAAGGRGRRDVRGRPARADPQRPAGEAGMIEAPVLVKRPSPVRAVLLGGLVHDGNSTSPSYAVPGRSPAPTPRPTGR